MHTVLVANRGEIAVRVIRAVRDLGLRAVAVYSDADADARHVQLADEAVRIGPGPATKSYLSVPALLAAVERERGRRRASRLRLPVRERRVRGRRHRARLDVHRADRRDDHRVPAASSAHASGSPTLACRSCRAARMRS